MPMVPSRSPAVAEELDLRRFVRLLWRGATLRCANCGGGRLFASMLTLRERCPTCGLRLERGESDYFLGAYLFNLVAVELLFAGAFVGAVVVTWPDPPWTLLKYGALALVVVGAVGCYPFAKTLWLAVDLALRPPTAEDFHRAPGAEPATAPR